MGATITFIKSGSSFDHRLVLYDVHGHCDMDEDGWTVLTIDCPPQLPEWEPDTIEVKFSEREMCVELHTEVHVSSISTSDIIEFVEYSSFDRSIKSP